MQKAQLNYLAPLFKLATEFMGQEGDTDWDASFGLGTIDEGSSLQKDDENTDGFWTSAVVGSSVSATLDHILTLRSIVLDVGWVTNHAPWTLLRGALEPATTALWVMSGNSRQYRRERAFRVIYHDMSERSKWEQDTGWTPTGKARSGRDQMERLRTVGASLGLRANQITTALSHADLVSESARVVGLDPKLARARWREASGFAHGRQWPVLNKSIISGASRIPGGFALQFTLNEEHHELLADLTFKVFERAILMYGEQSIA